MGFGDGKITSMKIGERLRRGLTCNNDLVGDDLVIYPGDEPCADARAKRGLPPLTSQELPKKVSDGRLRQICLGCPELLELMAQSGLTTEDIPKSYVSGT